MAYSLQNFYKQTLLLDWSIGTGNFYVTTKPTVASGWLVISPNNSTLREIVRYTAVGTDANGDYVTVSIRGVGGTTEQIHSVGEPIRMNITAEYWEDMNTQIASIIASGVVNANTTTMGGVEIATAAEVDAGTATGATGASIVLTPDNVNAAHNIPFVAPGTSGNVMTSNGLDWISQAAAVAPFSIQDVPISTTAFGASTGVLYLTTQVGSNSALYYAYCPNSGSQIDIYRFQKQSSGQYVRTHTASLSCSSNGLRGIVATSTYIYIFAVIGGTRSCRRYSLTDLSGVTTMTFTGTTNDHCWTDGTDIFIQAASGTFDRYTVSGTTLTNAGNVSFTSSSFTGTSYCDGTNVWLTDGAAGTFSIRKYAKTGGAVISTTSVFFNPSAYYNLNGGSSNFNFFYAGTTSLGLGWGFDMSTPTAQSGSFLHLTAIDLP